MAPFLARVNPFMLSTIILLTITHPSFILKQMKALLRILQDSTSVIFAISPVDMNKKIAEAKAML
ncbi:hypothetical protein GCM10020370_19760 [Paenibacillus hodogayensis]